MASHLVFCIALSGSLPLVVFNPETQWLLLSLKFQFTWHSSIYFPLRIPYGVITSFACWTPVKNGGLCFHPRDNLRQEVVTSSKESVWKSVAISLFVFCVHVRIRGNRRTQFLEQASSSINIITLALPTDRFKHNKPSSCSVLSTRRLCGGIAEVQVWPLCLVIKVSSSYVNFFNPSWEKFREFRSASDLQDPKRLSLLLVSAAPQFLSLQNKVWCCEIQS